MVLGGSEETVSRDRSAAPRFGGSRLEFSSFLVFPKEQEDTVLALKEFESGGGDSHLPAPFESQRHVLPNPSWHCPPGDKPMNRETSYWGKE